MTAISFLLFLLALSAPLASQSLPDSAQVLDNFETLDRWSALPSEGVALTLNPDQGHTGDSHAMRLDFDFQGRGGYAIARRRLGLALPENYEFSFWIRGNARPNTLEFKLADSSGDNVWWYTRPSFEFPHQWQRVTIKRRHIRFAWGPAGGGELRQAATLELVVTWPDGTGSREAGSRGSEASGRAHAFLLREGGGTVEPLSTAPRLRMTSA